MSYSSSRGQLKRMGGKTNWIAGWINDRVATGPMMMMMMMMLALILI